MTGLTGLTVWGETVKKVKTVITKNYIPNVNKVRKVSTKLGRVSHNLGNIIKNYL